MKSVLGLLAITSLLACSKSPSGASAASACKNMEKLGMPGAAENCPKIEEEMRKMFGDNYQAGLQCVADAKSKDDFGACTMKHADKEELAKGMATYKAKSQAVEAKMHLRMLHNAVAVFYSTPSFDPNSLTAAIPEPALPESVGPTPAIGSCCKTSDKCEPDAKLWSEPGWLALDFSMNDPHYYSYEYKRSDDGKSYTVSAYGDLDCDGDFSTYRVSGGIGADGSIEDMGEIQIENALE